MKCPVLRIRSFFLAATLGIAAVGCNAPLERTHSNGHLSYAAARGYDFMDMFEVNVAAGVGLQAAVEITPVRVAYGYYDVTKMGTMGRSCGVWDEVRKEFFFVHSFMYWEKQPCYGDDFLFDADEMHLKNQQRGVKDHTRERFYEKWDWTTRYEDWERPWLDCVLEAHALFLGAELAFSPQECADFFLGIIGVDTVSHDDWRAADRALEPVSIPGQGAPPTFDPPPTPTPHPIDPSNPPPPPTHGN